MTKPNTHSRGSAKVVIILVLVAMLGAAMLGAATLLYLNRDKLSLLGGGETKQPETTVDNSSSSANGSTGVRRPVVASSPQQVTERSYDSYMQRDDVLVLVDYYADWCGPCRGIAPSLAKLASAHGDKVVVLKVDVDREKALASRAGVRSIPDVRLIHKGSQLERIVGGFSYQHYESLVLKHEHRLPAPTASGSNPPAQKKPAGTITPLKKDWLPPGVSPLGS